MTFLRIDNLDIVKLKDGRKATVLETFAGGSAFYVEVPQESGDDYDWFEVTADQIEKVIWCSKTKQYL